jgi:hypothetical protein
MGWELRNLIRADWIGSDRVLNTRRHRATNHPIIFTGNPIMKANLTSLILFAAMLQAEELNLPPVEETPAEAEVVEKPEDAVKEEGDAEKKEEPVEEKAVEEMPAGEGVGEAEAPAEEASDELELMIDPVTGEPLLTDPAEGAAPAMEDPLMGDGEVDELVLEIDASDELTLDLGGEETPLEEEIEDSAEGEEESTEGWQFTLGGNVSAEMQAFPQSAQDPRQDDWNLSFALEPEFKWRNKESGLTVQFNPFARYDMADDERSHADLRELSLRKEFGESDLLVGVSKVFWGAMESVHWVDVINQTDLIENIDGEAKLGQPMINYNQFTDYGRFSFFVLPGFRDRTFPGADGRLRVHPRIDADKPLYESGAEEGHVDFALRWSKSFGDVDVGVSWFHGTSREPTYVPDLLSSGEVILRPYYEIVDQIGIDGTWNLDDWLFKSEVMVRSGQGDESFFRAGAGVEYTFYGVAGSGVDVGVIGELLYDSSGNNPINPFENDIAYGARIAFNDIRDSVLLVTAVTDLRDGSTFFNLEASMRFGEHWVATAQARAFAGVPRDDYPLNGYLRDHYAQFGIEYHF